jgi:hypothetical protein
MTATEAATRRLYAELREGDTIEVDHQIKVGLKVWNDVTRGTVVRTERRRHGLHHQRNADDKVYSDVIVLSREDGELTTITVDEYTVLRRVE